MFLWHYLLPFGLGGAVKAAGRVCTALHYFVQLIPEISSLSAVTTAVPLFSVLSLTAIKYGYDDIVSTFSILNILYILHNLLNLIFNLLNLLNLLNYYFSKDIEQTGKSTTENPR